MAASLRTIKDKTSFSFSSLPLVIVTADMSNAQLKYQRMMSKKMRVIGSGSLLSPSGSIVFTR
jgi:hypothetical protein